MKFLFLSIALLLMTGVIFAQTSGNQSETMGEQNVQTVRGCLSKTGNTYALLGGNPVRQYRIVGGNIAALNGQQGHTVEITGEVGQKKSGASTNGKYSAGSTTGVGYDTIKVRSVKEAAPTCS